ncbi:cbb3-type cytochrome c oxidase subunit I [Veillonella rogosae]|uniref:cbb3-type cytochrome c oxidase subunit I n=1 Tax=Veillonella rogosae TaxID=423477 RepID=UPI002092E6F7|nr:cbb3-type cytochrome c oxidase subunit I [Veillonella rogosae]
MPGTFHHLYFTGVTSTIVATGASFSALEVVPLVLLGYEAFENYTRLHSAPWMHRLKWPVYCFIAVSFWNLVGGRGIRVLDQHACILVLHPRS